MGATGATASTAYPVTTSGSYGVLASDAAPATYPVPTAPANYVMQSSQGPATYQVPTAMGGMYGEGSTPPQDTWMHRLMEYVKRNPPQNPDRSMPSAPSAQQAPPPQASRLLGQSGQYPTLSSLMAAQLPTITMRG